MKRLSLSAIPFLLASPTFAADLDYPRYSEPEAYIERPPRVVEYRSYAPAPVYEYYEEEPLYYSYGYQPYFRDNGFTYRRSHYFYPRWRHFHPRRW